MKFFSWMKQKLRFGWSDRLQVPVLLLLVLPVRALLVLPPHLQTATISVDSNSQDTQEVHLQPVNSSERLKTAEKTHWSCSEASKTCNIGLKGSDSWASCAGQQLYLVVLGAEDSRWRLRFAFLLPQKRFTVCANIFELSLGPSWAWH